MESWAAVRVEPPLDMPSATIVGKRAAKVEHRQADKRSRHGRLEGVMPSVARHAIRVFGRVGDSHGPATSEQKLNALLAWLRVRHEEQDGMEEDTWPSVEAESSVPAPLGHGPSLQGFPYEAGH